jgi:hypothetical protein
MRRPLAKKERSVRKVLALAALAAAAVPAVYSAYVAIAIIDRGYTWKEMDWNGDGRTQLSEVFAAGDIVPHRTVRGGQRCTHYFAYRTATLVRSDCEADA